MNNKDKIIKFSGCYHGHSDSFLIEAGSGVVTFGTPNSRSRCVFHQVCRIPRMAVHSRGEGGER